jgi:hypothetical protein
MIREYWKLVGPTLTHTCSMSRRPPSQSPYPTASSIGRRPYEGRARAEPGGDDLLVWHMTYRTLEDGRVLDERRATANWWVFPLKRLADELAEYGLSVVRGRRRR